MGALSPDDFRPLFPAEGVSPAQAAALAAASEARLHADVREIEDLWKLARDCLRAGPGHDPARARRTLARIGAICAGYAIERGEG